MNPAEEAREVPPLRGVRSYVRREGRMTTAQARALETLVARYAAPLPALANPLALFGRLAPRVLEIGTGNGENVLARACARADCDFLAVEVHRPGVGHLLNQAAALGTTNLRVCIEDARDVVACLPAQSIDVICVFFPDPWPKLRHHKRRLVQVGFLTALRQCLARHGRIHLATDIDDYADAMAAAIEATPGLVNLAGAGERAPRPRQRILTRFERRGLARGHTIHDFVVARRD